MKIYTRTGDKGQTSLFDGTRVLKSNERVDAYGTVDELNSMVGAAIAQMKNEKAKIKNELERIQNDLLDIGSALAMPAPLPVTGLEKRTKEFEGLIDNLTDKLPDLKNFILPGGGKAGSLLHVARTVCRRAERRVVALLQHEDVSGDLIIYLNRLSDLLFTIARYVNFQENQKEIIWKKKMW